MGRLTIKRTSKFSGSKSGGSHLKRLSWEGNSLFHLPRLSQLEIALKAPQLQTKNPRRSEGLLWYYRDSNLGHTDFQSVALPTELSRLKLVSVVRCCTCLAVGAYLTSFELLSQPFLSEFFLTARSLLNMHKITAFSVEHNLQWWALCLQTETLPFAFPGIACQWAPSYSVFSR